MYPTGSQDWHSCIEGELTCHEVRLNDIAASLTQISQRLVHLSRSSTPELEPELQPQSEMAHPLPGHKPPHHNP